MSLMRELLGLSVQRFLWITGVGCVCVCIYIYIDDKFRTQIQIVMIDHSKTSATSLGSKVSHILQL